MQQKRCTMKLCSRILFCNNLSMYAEAIRAGTDTLGRNHPLVVRWQSNLDLDMNSKELALSKNQER